MPEHPLAPAAQNKRPVVGRFAPSPSGRLHLGNLGCSLLAWLSAKSAGGRILLRIEDLDAERCPRVYADAIEADLSWLGLYWDEGGSAGGPHGPYYQSMCAPVYEQAYETLREKGLLYPCFCSRAALHAASAPHRSDGDVIYPGTCSALTAEQAAALRKKKSPAVRVRVPDESISFIDGHMGDYAENLARDCGDFVVRRGDGVLHGHLAIQHQRHEVVAGGFAFANHHLPGLHQFGPHVAHHFARVGSAQFDQRARRDEQRRSLHLDVFARLGLA